MSIETDLFTTLKALCGNRVFPDKADLGTALPYVTYSQIGGEVISPVANEVADKKNGRLQFNVWGTRAQCASLILQIESALVTSTLFQARPIGAASITYDYDMAFFGAQLDFSVWSSR